VFRGLRDLSRAYVAMLGGSATFGKYVDRLSGAGGTGAGAAGRQSGGLNAGPDFISLDPATLDIAAGACRRGAGDRGRSVVEPVLHGAQPPE
jgi:hypothetical protein